MQDNKLVEVWTIQRNAPGLGLDETPRKVRTWLPWRVALAGGYELVKEGKE